MAQASQYPTATNWFVAFRVPFPSTWGAIKNEQGEESKTIVDLILGEMISTAGPSNDKLSLDQQYQTRIPLKHGTSLRDFMLATAPEVKRVTVAVFESFYGPNSGSLRQSWLKHVVASVAAVFGRFDVEFVRGTPTTTEVFERETFDVQDFFTERASSAACDFFGAEVERIRKGRVEIRKQNGRDWACEEDVWIMFWFPEASEEPRVKE